MRNLMPMVIAMETSRKILQLSVGLRWFPRWFQRGVMQEEKELGKLPHDAIFRKEVRGNDMVLGYCIPKLYYTEDILLDQQTSLFLEFGCNADWQFAVSSTDSVNAYLQSDDIATDVTTSEWLLNEVARINPPMTNCTIKQFRCNFRHISKL